MELLRVVMHVVVGILIIQYTAPFLNYLIKDTEEECKSADEQKS